MSKGPEAAEGKAPPQAQLPSAPIASLPPAAGTLLSSSLLQPAAAAAAAKSLQSCPTLCDPIDSSPLGSSVPGILQTRILEWVAISFSNA